MDNKMTHKEVVNIAYRWVLKNARCGVAFKELDCCSDTGEIPDVIGFNTFGHSVLVEVKVTRSDFLSDKNKKFRKEYHTGMGSKRYYCCPTGLIKQSELPEGWGLVYVNENKKATKVYCPFVRHDDNPQKNIRAEHSLMYSALRRLFIKGYVKHIYDKEYNRSTTPDELIQLNHPQQLSLLNPSTP